MSTTTPYQTMPPLSADEYANLEQSIRGHGIQVPIIVDEDGVVIDGHHRQMIADSLGISCPVEVKFGLDDAEKRSLSISLNIDRRQLSREQRRSIIEDSLRADPELSNREHARRVGVDDKTVGVVRRELESTAEIPQSDTRLSADGRERPATQPERRLAAVEYVDPATGELVDRPVKITETETVTRVSEPMQIPRALKPVLTGAAAAQLNREEGAKHFADALFNLWQLTFEQHRTRLVKDIWPLGSASVPPDDIERATPDTFRAIAVALNQLADEWEN